jgi:hypothetical protein
MRNDSIVLAMASLSLLCPVATAQEAEKPTLYAEVQYMQVPEGGDELYLKVENAWKKIHSIRKEAGIVSQWVVCKVHRTEGPPADYNYAVIHIFDSWEKLKKLYPAGLLDGKLSLTDEEQQAINRTREARTMVRTQLWELDEVAVPSRLGQTDFDNTLVLSFMKSKDAGRHVTLEREVWKKIWAQAATDGFRANWHLWICRYPGGQDRPVDEAAVHLFPKGQPKKSLTREWWEQSVPKIFPDKSREELDKLFEETRQVRDIPITEEWQIILALDMER